LGIDPGLAETGYGIIDYDKCRYKYVCHGVIQTYADAELSDRLLSIFNQLEKIIIDYKPVEAGIESIFFSRNVLSAIPVAHAKGVIHLLFAQNNISATEYSPLQIKQTIVGNGRAEKKQVQELVKILLQLDKIPEPDHSADALAAALCHCNNRSFKNV
jgi:crossover junction endodeoxyribonuclease RuvC